MVEFVVVGTKEERGEGLLQRKQIRHHKVHHQNSKSPSVSFHPLGLDFSWNHHDQHHENGSTILNLLDYHAIYMRIVRIISLLFFSVAD